MSSQRTVRAGFTLTTRPDERNGKLCTQKANAYSVALLLGGRMVIHTEGFRASSAQIIALSTDLVHNQKDLARTASRYGVEAIPGSEIETYVEKYGTPIPKSLLP